MEKIYSKIEPNKLLHIVNRLSEIEGRTDVVDNEHFIQCATLKMEKGKTFKPHKHIEKERHYDKQIAQESWIVIKGSVKCIFYDVDDSIIATPILKTGDASFTLYGGHTYEILEDDTIVYEYKTGPYEGQSLDKIFIKNLL
jgi:cupin fold WbuC family metalloprotein